MIFTVCRLYHHDFDFIFSPYHIAALHKWCVRAYSRYSNIYNSLLHSSPCSLKITSWYHALYFHSHSDFSQVEHHINKFTQCHTKLVLWFEVSPGSWCCNGYVLSSLAVGTTNSIWLEIVSLDWHIFPLIGMFFFFWQFVSLDLVLAWEGIELFRKNFRSAVRA